MPDRPFLNRLDSDVVVSGAAIFISLCTLVVLLYEARIMREQQRAAVWPYVEIGAGFNEQEFHVITRNQGVGPARIQSLRVLVDGEPVRTWEEMFYVLNVDTTRWGMDKTNDRVLPGQSSLRTLEAAGGERSAHVREAYLSEHPRLGFSLCYCSVYDECWRVTTRGIEEERGPVGSCEADPEREFLY